MSCRSGGSLACSRIEKPAPDAGLVAACGRREEGHSGRHDRRDEWLRDGGR